MKITEIKRSVFIFLKVESTQQLKKQYSSLVKGLDLRTKVAWQKIELLMQEEVDSLFQKVIAQMEKENQNSNRIIQNSLDDWQSFKNKVMAESEAENNGKLSHLSDYRLPRKSSKHSKKNSKSKSPKIINFKN